jgi:hypothetical protein
MLLGTLKSSMALFSVVRLPPALPHLSFSTFLLILHPDLFAVLLPHDHLYASRVSLRSLLFRWRDMPLI